MDEDFAYVFTMMVIVALVLMINITYIMYLLTLPNYEEKKSRMGLKKMDVDDIAIGPCGELDAEDQRLVKEYMMKCSK